jgi:hypothetical protein
VEPAISRWEVTHVGGNVLFPSNPLADIEDEISLANFDSGLYVEIGKGKVRKIRQTHRACDNDQRTAWGEGSVFRKRVQLRGAISKAGKNPEDIPRQLQCRGHIGVMIPQNRHGWKNEMKLLGQK